MMLSKFLSPSLAALTIAGVISTAGFGAEAATPPTKKR